MQTDFNAVRGELAKDIQEKKLRVLMTKEFDRLREVSQIDNFLAGKSQSGGRQAGPVGLAPAGQSASGGQPPHALARRCCRPSGRHEAGYAPSRTGSNGRAGIAAMPRGAAGPQTR